MAQVKKVDNRFCVTHDTTGAVLKRKGKNVCYATRAEAEAAADAKATRTRVMGKRGLKPGVGFDMGGSHFYYTILFGVSSPS